MSRSVFLQLRFWATILLLLASLGFRAHAVNEPGWGLLSNESTLEGLTVAQTGQEHWSEFWWVILDGHLYLRLGRRGATRIEGNTRNPFVSVKIAGQRLDDVRVILAPEMAAAVAAAMAKKYSLDLLIRYFPHPMTVQLERGGREGQTDDDSHTTQ